MKLILRALLLLGLATLLQATQKHKAAGKTVRLVLDPSVQRQIAATSASTIANMSLSPWTYSNSYVASRLPARLSRAQCLTSGCLSLQGGGEDASLMAKPIYYQVLVLHRVQRQKHSKKGRKKPRTKYDFRLGTEVIAVGCTCVRPSVVPQQ
ncbi:interleukin 17a/f3 [Pempheris klunzingeri]|uniref:interleukin 17a/f3 n=1 Tax=Pempheris klunzingeri TaxID=3127111 RepID=UPI00397E9AED